MPRTVALPARRRIGRAALERAWLLAVLGWSCVRIGAVTHLLAHYGVQPLRYALIDLGTSGPYALASGRTVGALVDGRGRAASAWFALALVTFAAPDLYILSAGRAMPLVNYAVVGAVFSVAAGLALRAGRRKLALSSGVTPDRAAR